MSILCAYLLDSPLSLQTRLLDSTAHRGEDRNHTAPKFMCYTFTQPQGLTLRYGS